MSTSPSESESATNLGNVDFAFDMAQLPLTTPAEEELPDLDVDGFDLDVPDVPAPQQSHQQEQQQQQPQQQPKTKKPRKKRDPNAPSAVSSAYAFFFKETQASVKRHNPEAKFGEVSKLVAHLWESAPEEEKLKFRKMNEEDKSRYEREMKEYKAKQQDLETASTSNPPVKTVLGQHGKVTTQLIKKPFEKIEEAKASSVCLRDGCARSAVSSPEWEDEYCSNECVVQHCKNVFRNWISASSSAATAQ